jgi:hypothetical protein
VCSLEGGAPKGMRLREFPNLTRMSEYWNLPLHKQLSFYFLASFLFRNISMGTWEHINMGELPRHNDLRLFCWGRSLKIHIEIKRELFTEPKRYFKEKNATKVDIGARKRLKKSERIDYEASS